MTCRGSSGGGGSQERVTLKELVKSPADMPSPDAKPEYYNAICTVANIDPQQSMYYQACPDNNRKVSTLTHASSVRQNLRQHKLNLCKASRASPEKTVLERPTVF